MRKIDTLEAREQYVEDLHLRLQRKINLDDVQLFVFGSFLTSEFVLGKSDIDVGVYSKNEVKMYNTRYELEKLLDEDGLKHDVIIMRLSEKLWINIPILLYGKQLTKYEDYDLFEYLKRMIDKWSFQPLLKSMIR